MSIFEYEEGELSNGFVGLRVNVSVGSEIMQRWFSFRGKRNSNKRNTRVWVSATKEKLIRRKARKLEKQWLADQAEAHEEYVAAAIPTARGNACAKTGIRGINIVYLPSNGRSIKNVYFNPNFIVQVKKNGVLSANTFSINHWGFDRAWFMAVDAFCAFHGFYPVEYYGRKPKKSCLNAAKKHAEQHFGVVIK